MAAPSCRSMSLLDLGNPLRELLPFDPAGRLGFLDEAKLVKQEVDRLLPGRQLGTKPVESPAGWAACQGRPGPRLSDRAAPSSGRSPRGPAALLQAGDLILKQGDCLQVVRIRLVASRVAVPSIISGFSMPISAPTFRRLPLARQATPAMLARSTFKSCFTIASRSLR